MRVISGSSRGTRLKTLESNSVRPTSDRVKEAMFSAIQFDIEGKRVLDGFAGSGALGIEALSRGAKSCHFFDSDFKAVSVIRENLEKTGLSDKAQIERRDFFVFFSAASKTVFDLIFLDPPYGRGLILKALNQLAACRALSDCAIIICESGANEELPRLCEGFGIDREYIYGTTKVTIYRGED